MVRIEFWRTRKDGTNLYRTYSDEGLKLIKYGTDEVYDEAVDVEGSDYIYIESDEMTE